MHSHVRRSESSSAIFYANHSTYPTTWHELLKSNPVLLELPAGVRAAGDHIVSTEGWQLTIGGGGKTAQPTFTCSVDPRSTAP